jgi:RNA polymerase sigma-70 factor, ECF subfamily
MPEHIRLHLLVLRCQAGDERAFAQLFGAFGKRTLAYLRGLLGEDGEDVQQEVWLAVYRNLSRLSNPRAFRTWLYQTTRHRAIDFLRRRKRECELIDGAAVELSTGADPHDEGSGLAVSGQELQAALAELSPLQREVLLLRYQDDLSYAEIALVLGCSIGTVRSRLHHAKRRMLELKGGY